MPLSFAVSDGRRVNLEAESVTIGSDAGSDLAFPGAAGVLPRHARIVRRAGGWQLDAAGDVQVNGQPGVPGRPLVPGDVIRLTSTGPEIVFQPPPDDSPRSSRTTGSLPKLPDLPVGPIEELDSFKSPTAARPVPAGRPVPRAVPGPAIPPGEPQAPAQSGKGPSRTLWTAAAIGIAALAISVLVFLLPREPRSDSTPGKDGSGSQVALNTTAGTSPESNSPGTPRPGQTEPTPVFPEPEPPGPKETRPQPTPVAPPRTDTPPNRNTALVAVIKATPAQVQQSLYAVFLRHAETSKSFRLGTACAVSPRQLATSAAVVLAAERLRKDGGLTVVLKAIGSDRELPVIHLLPHPSYRLTRQNVAGAEAQATELEVRTQDAKGDEAAALQAKRDSLQEYIAETAVQQLWFDVGLLTVADDLPWSLRLSRKPLPPGTAVRVVGLPWKDAEIGSTGLPSKPAEVQGTSSTLPRAVYGAAAWLVDLSAAPADLNWVGAPVLDDAGTVLGVCSRPDEAGRQVVTDAGRIKELQLVRP